MEKLHIGIELTNGENYGCVSIHASVKDSKPTLTFISSGFVKTVFPEEIKNIKIYIDNWCPQCQ